MRLFVLLFSLLSLCFGIPISDKNAFLRADKNQNGVLEKSEFKAYAQKLMHALEPFVDVLKDNEQDENANLGEGIVSHQGIFRFLNGFWTAFGSGILTIWATEVGDKTFFIAAILSMKHERSIIFAGAIGALIVMTVLSVMLGGVVGYFLPVELTHYAGTILFIFFGLRMLYDARGMDDKPSEELAEVEEELQSKKDGNLDTGKPDMAKAGVMKVISQAFMMTFLAEWGDRSQIATITLSTTKNALGVTLGAILGHSMCTGLAVVGGKMLATRISEKTVTLIGGILFLIFGAHSIIVGPA